MTFDALWLFEQEESNDTNKEYRINLNILATIRNND